MTNEAHSVPDLSAYGIDSHWLRRKPASRTLLFAYPHPDDESFGNGGTIARYAAEGVAVHYACATRGEVGEVDPKLLQGYADLAELRTAELERAAQYLGLAAVHFLGYRDSGMPGMEANSHPAALIQAPLEAVTGRMTALIRVLRPQVVVTFNTYGGYGHPDHIHLHLATVAAFHAAADPNRYPEQIAAGLEPYQPKRLYYSTISTRFLRMAIANMRLRRRDPRRGGKNGDVDYIRAMEAATTPTTVVDVLSQADRRDAAWHSHVSQLDGSMVGMLKLPRAIRHRLLSTESFTRIEPPWVEGARLERGLFDGLDGES